MMAPSCEAAARTGVPSAAAPGWRAGTRFMVRSAGFPFALVDTSSPALVTALARRRALLERLGRERSALAGEVAPAAKAALAGRGAAKPEYKALYRLLRVATVSDRPVACPPEAPGFLRDWAARWNAAAEALAECQAEAGEHALRAERRAAGRMGSLTADPAFGDAVLLSSPGVYERVVAGWRWPARPGPGDGEAGEMTGRERRDARTVYAYAQRLATKNETTSFFGPIDYGWLLPAPLPDGRAVGDGLSGNPNPGGRTDRAGSAVPQGGDRVPCLRLRRAPGLHLARKARLTAWAAEAVGAVLASDPALRGQLPVRVRPGLAVADGAVLNALTGRRVRVPGAWLRALEACERGVPLDAARARVGAEIVDRVVARGLAEVGWVLPAAADDPLEWVRGQLAGLAGTVPGAAERWLPVLDRLQRLADGFERAPSGRRLAALDRLEREFSEVTGVSARRGEGTMYADRMVITEDCRGNAALLELGADAAAAVTGRLAPALSLCASYSLVVRDVIERRALEVFSRAAPAGRMPYLAFAAAIDQAVDMAGVLQAPAVRDWLSELDRLVGGRERDGIAQLGDADLAGLLRPCSEPVVLSPDIFLGGDPCHPGTDPDTVPIVVGEIHHGVQTWTHLSALDPEPGAAENAVAGLVPDRSLAGNVFRRTEGKAFERELPGPAVEFRSVSAHPRAEPLRIESLWVTRGEEGLRLSTAGGSRLLLRARHPRSASNWLLGQLPVVMPVPLRSAPRAPRVLVGDVTVWRRRWLLGGQRLAPLRRARHPGELALAADDLRAGTGLPRMVFARAAGARKPVFADLSCPLSLRHLIHYADGETDLAVTEMLPSPDQWWWRPASVPHSCEWRMTFVSGPVRDDTARGLAAGAS